MTKVMIEMDVYNPVYEPYLDEMARTQIFFGGSSSGKSYFLIERCIDDIMHGGRNYLICRQVARTLRGSVFTQATRIIDEWGVGALFNVNKSDMLITCSNGYQIIFAGLDDTEKLKSLTPAKGSITDVLVDEATETERKDIKQLYKRQRGGSSSIPKRLTLSFNPILKSSWIYDEYFKTINWSDSQTEYKSPELSILKTWYIHNAFLTPDDIRDLENEKDPYFYSVYTLGNWGVLGNVIFTNWRTEDLSGKRDQFVNRRNGLDFGFSSDPAALSRSHYDRAKKTIYVFEEFYERGLTNDMLASDLKRMIASDPVTCDSAEPKSIAELQKYGISAYSASKGKDSVLHGIQWLQQQTIILDVSCINARNELSQYKWREDKNGDPMPQPVDRHNHWIDATRYAYEGDMGDSRIFL